MDANDAANVCIGFYRNSTNKKRLPAMTPILKFSITIKEG
jgi:hypothetical protein